MRTMPFEKIGEGSTANVYRITSDTCLKEYKSVLDDLDMPITDRVKMKVSIFEILKTMDLPGLYKLRDIFAHFSNVSGYTYEYVKSIPGSLGEQDMDYIINSFYDLEKIGNILTSECIRIEDTNNANTIISPNGLTIIDVDMYHQTRDISNLRIHNKQEIKNYILSKLCNGKLYTQEDIKLIEEIFSFDYESSKSLALQAEESFKHPEFKRLFR